MASGKEIRGKIASIKNTQKITKAMELVAASKMRRAKLRMDAARPYADKIKRVIGHLTKAHPEYKHAFMTVRPVKRVGVVVITSDRGLCGGLNANLLRRLSGRVKEWQTAGTDVSYSVIGSKGASFFKSFGGNLLATKTGLGDKPHVTDLIGSVKVMLDAYEQGNIDELWLMSNEFVNTMTQKPTMHRMLPIAQEDVSASNGHWDYLYEPEAKDVLDALLKRYVESMVYTATVENVACEMSARMIAMKNATDNAGKFIKELQLAYNKARQAAITAEISEITAGAAAVSG
ncbi:MAG: F0F1 ATP synthase subunit gamma [Thiotrichales bacterium 32-46-8]|nr:MAG: F0F1 ATP synthase subunit gamma [Thiotrichales bacterium 32-46-8]OZA19098.1 MAG: F0F1 ATP synthase subunit gamma [Thiotrichales bacterium 17-46-47]HQT02723.1 F0F1 ATP synthase subunit gamma [Thiotrichales bacterium]HQT04176.1 F0F1 ATP synthase subunit gamma [Thiotrichales bacterium]